MIGGLILVAQMTLNPNVTDEWVEETIRKARPVATCRIGPDCEAKWSRARQWIVGNSRFSLARDTDSVLITHGAIYANTDPSLAIALDPPLGGVRRIRFRAWCGNWFTCRPSPGSLRRLFIQAMEDVRTSARPCLPPLATQSRPCTRPPRP